MWRWVKKHVKLWASLGEIVAIFGLGCAATAYVLDRLDSGANEAVLPVDKRLDRQSSRMDRIETFIREQVAFLQGQISQIRTEQADATRATNQRLDQTNVLLMQIIKNQSERTGGGGWVIPDAKASGP